MIMLFNWIKNNNTAAITVIVFGWLLDSVIVTILIKINLKDNTSEVANILYLLFQRTLFVAGASISFLPFLLGTPIVRPLINMMESAMWFPLAKLTYGAYLSHCIFMLFRTYNTQRGVWASELDTTLFFFAYLTFAFMFSFFVTVLVETPMSRLLKEFKNTNINAVENV